MGGTEQTGTSRRNRAAMTERTTRGVRLQAKQRSNRDESVVVRNLTVRSEPEGLKITAEVGHGRGFALEITLTLEEIVAWMPDLLAQEAERTDMQVRAAEQRMRALAAQEGKVLGVDLPYLEGDP